MIIGGLKRSEGPWAHGHGWVGRLGQVETLRKTRMELDGGAVGKMKTAKKVLIGITGARTQYER